MAIGIITKITQKITKTNTSKNNALKNAQSGDYELWAAQDLTDTLSMLEYLHLPEHEMTKSLFTNTQKLITLAITVTILVM